MVCCVDERSEPRLERVYEGCEVVTSGYYGCCAGKTALVDRHRLLPSAGKVIDRPPLWSLRQRTVVGSGVRLRSGHVECGTPDWIREGGSCSSKRSYYCEIPEPFVLHGKKILDMLGCRSFVPTSIAFSFHSCCQSVVDRRKTWAPREERNRERQREGSDQIYWTRYPIVLRGSSQGAFASVPARSGAQWCRC